ncbi:MAG: hypothetical protein ABJB86_04325 [Bacteroidota bacterium]
MRTLTRSPLLLLLAVTCIASGLIVSCNNANPPGSVVIEIPKDNSGLDTIHHFIPEALEKEYLSAFKAQQDSFNVKNPSLLIPVAEAFNKPALLSLLKAKDCVGLRIYHGIKKGGRGVKDEIRLVIVGVDSKGNDILIDSGSVLTTKITSDQVAVERGQCPTCQAVQANQ